MIYSGLGEKADSVIKRILDTEKGDLIVVSSDREIARHAWSAGAVPVPSEAFLPRIPGGEGVYQGGDYPEEDEKLEGRSESRGAGQRLSRKERALRRALSRL